MIIALSHEQYNKDYILFSEQTKNNILNNGHFYRIFYSPPTFCLNGIHVFFNLKDVHLESYFNKIKCTFGRSNNNTIIEFIKNIERDILAVSPSEGNAPVYRIEEQLSQGFIKIFSDDEYKRVRAANIQILLKISGVWTDSTNYGITFRFFFNHQ
jgi:hypothetical protein